MSKKEDSIWGILGSLLGLVVIAILSGYVVVLVLYAGAVWGLGLEFSWQVSIGVWFVSALLRNACGSK